MREREKGGIDSLRKKKKLNLYLDPPQKKTQPPSGLPEGVHDLPAEPLPALLPPSPPPSPAEEDAIALALPLIALREFRRAAGALSRARARNGASEGVSRPSPSQLTPRGAFLLAWSRYLAGRARAVAKAGAASAAAASSGAAAGGAGGRLFGEAADAAAGSSALGDGGGDGDGTSLEEIEAELAPYLGGRTSSSSSSESGSESGSRGGGEGGDPFCLFLLGLVSADAGRPRAARAALLASVRSFPLNWGAWLALAALDAAERGGGGGGGGVDGGGSGGSGPISSASSLSAVDAAVSAALPLGGLPHHWASFCYLAHVSADAGDDPADALSRARALAGGGGGTDGGNGGNDSGPPGLPRSPFVAGVAASAHYASRNFDEAGEIWEAGLAADPHRLEGLVSYSNVLYVRGDSASLAALAATLASTAPFSAAAASVAGNYHSLRGDHGRALACFRRSLALEGPSNAGGGIAGGGIGGGSWTLMGHEYLELKNPAAAVASYRKAVSLAPRDHRAWYGLGQAYELLGAPHAALHYFRRAAALRPADARMWVAVGQCLELLASPSSNPSITSEDGSGGVATSLHRHPVRDAALAAKKAYRRAVDAGDGAGAALAALARIAEGEGDDDGAAAYHEAVVAAAAARAGVFNSSSASSAAGSSPSIAAEAAALLDETLATLPPPGPDEQDSLLFLAAYYRDRGEWGRAERAALRLLRAGLSGAGSALGTGGDATMREVAELLEDVRAAREEEEEGGGGGGGGGGGVL